MARTPDGCLVETEPLAALLRQFVDEWNRDRPQTAGRFGSEITPVKPAAWLATAATVPESTIQHILERRYRMTEYRHADALLQALELPHILPHWTVYPNPSARAEDRMECCAGSTMPPVFDAAAVA